MRIRTAIISGILSCVAVASAAAVGLYRVDSSVDVALRHETAAEAIVHGVFELSILNNKYLLHREDRARAQWNSRHAALGQVLDRVEAVAMEDREVVQRLRAGYANIDEIFRHLVAAGAVETSEAPRPGAPLQLERRLQERLLAESQEMVAAAADLARRNQAHLRDATHAAQRILGLLVACVLLLEGVTWLLVNYRILRPLGRLHAGIGVVGRGDLSFRLGDAGRRDEIGDLAAAFDGMAQRLQESTVSRAELEAKIGARTAELVAANRELETFSYSVSHDLRAPLRSLDGFSCALLEDYGAQLDEAGQDYLKRIRQAAVRMGVLIDDLLKLSQVTRREIHHEPVALSAIAREVVEELSAGEPERSVEVTIAPDLEARGDPALLRVVLQNLLHNAWKFSSIRERAVIEFAAKTDPSQHPVYYVRDNGAGFAMEYADKLFAPFQRLHSSEEFEGTGIGLATVQRALRRHHGKIWAEATPGAGATFFFTLA
jgi:signal transduction histidine kinase